jgi:Tfp pilus assembly protein PilN
VKAVNLIPAEERRGAGGMGGRSGGAAYIVLGALAALLVLATAYTLAGRTVHDRKGELARVEADAQAAEARAAELSAYTSFATLRAARVQTVRSIASSRFDWSFAMHEVARVIPDDVWLTTLTGTVSPDVALSSGAGGSGALRGAIPDPAIELTGCTTTQDEVARMMTRMRLIDGVRRVSLQESSKSDASGGGGGGGGGDDCRYGSDRFPKFSLVVFFEPVPQPAAATPATAAPAAADATAPASQTTTSPTGATP